MNPSTDAGRRDLPDSIRGRFSEVYVDELVDPAELGEVAVRYLRGCRSGGQDGGGGAAAASAASDAVDAYLKCRDLSESTLVDGAGHRPRYTMRTFCRALSAARALAAGQRFKPRRAMLEGFELAFEGPLDPDSRMVLREALRAALGAGLTEKDMDRPARRPGGRGGGDDYALIEPFWIRSGPLEPEDWAAAAGGCQERQGGGRSRFVLTPGASSHLRRLARAVSSGPYPVLLEGPTSAGKTTLVEYLAARLGRRCVRINNHEHTDVREYTGSYSAGPDGSLTFRDGVLVRALRGGDWVILDELNLAPSEVLEALNRLLDDNRELYIPETDEVVRPHPRFRLFATQNPSGLAYGGRKPLSGAFRNRFVEVRVEDIPPGEMSTILELRCGCPPSHAKLLVRVMTELRRRRSRSGVFRGRDGLITPRDLLRWAERWGSGGTASGGGKAGLAAEGYMLLAERLRDESERRTVREVLEDVIGAEVDVDGIYYGPGSDARRRLEELARRRGGGGADGADDDAAGVAAGLAAEAIAPTRSMLRLLSLVWRCARRREPALLVGETGCGKTTAVQIVSLLLRRRLHVVNCHATTETSDMIGGLRPVRGRGGVVHTMAARAAELADTWPDGEGAVRGAGVPDFLRRAADADAKPLPPGAAGAVLSFVRALWASRGETGGGRVEPPRPGGGDGRRKKKRRKLGGAGASPSSAGGGGMDPAAAAAASAERGALPPSRYEAAGALVRTVEALYRQYSSPFEWADGPLVSAMRSGHLLLLDEVSLAEDAVLERLNSVLEPGRRLVLAERGTGGDGDGDEGVEVSAHDDFLIFATMNPGGDFGKRELSPALRSRFTEIWVPAAVDRGDVDLVLERALGSAAERGAAAAAGGGGASPPPDAEVAAREMDAVRSRMLEYVDFFNGTVCGGGGGGGGPPTPCADLRLSLRDVLAWAGFVVGVRRAGGGGRATTGGSSGDADGERGLDLWSAYAHGAALTHLDGLGLGTGLSRDDAAEARGAAAAFLEGQARSEAAAWGGRCPDGCLAAEATAGRAFSVDGRGGVFGSSPFFIPVGPEPIPERLDFDLDAPTTGMNLMRVLRAMQIRKPILLEGSPGVGKTSLISALATASGHRLVRINLSEQTDISDLMGGDLPVPDGDPTSDDPSNGGGRRRDSAASGGGGSGGKFRWCDGALLCAIKRGDWVLLDELNLATQSVLEGLNSCLDHRANVYVPELGRTFDCPPTFRVFAAQNPLAQGGGRKGLPRSFLNRFAKVRVEALTDGDILSIVAARFPSLPESMAGKVVAFNGAVHVDVVERREYGTLGSPWEFNLRDVFRWCRLVLARDPNAGTDVHAVRDATETIYLQRLRTRSDRAMLGRRFEECFGVGISSEARCFVVEDNSVRVGGVTLMRGRDRPRKTLVQGTEPDIIKALMRPMEAVANCVNMNWPCLLVGASSTGKGTIVKTLSEACNMHLAEIALTPSSDVNELIGCFEQVDTAEHEKELLQRLREIHDTACQIVCDESGQLRILAKICDQFRTVSDHLARLDSTSPSKLAGNKALLSVIGQLMNSFEEAAKACTAFDAFCGRAIASARERLAFIRKHRSGKGLFRWVDGILVRALESGYWLHLENVNYCPSSVLDRLNPLMESGGELVLTECGITNDDCEGEGPRVVKAHPNFRLFLSMDPSSGEVSRAMRNRCIEVSLISPSSTGIGAVPNRNETCVENQQETPGTVLANEGLDAASCLRRLGSRSSLITKLMLDIHKQECAASAELPGEVPSARNLTELGNLTVGLLNRGWDAKSSLEKAQQLSYELSSNEDISSTWTDSQFGYGDALLGSVELRQKWALNPIYWRSTHEAQLIKLLSSASSNQLPQALVLLLPHVDMNSLDEYCLPLSHSEEVMSLVTKHTVAKIASKLSSALPNMLDILDGYCPVTSTHLKFMASSLFDYCLASSGHICFGGLDSTGCRDERGPPASDPPTSGYSDRQKDKPCYDHTCCVNRLTQMLEERITYEKLKRLKPDELTSRKWSPIAMSFCLYEGKIDRSFVACAVTPALFPLFASLDNLINTWDSAYIQGSCRTEKQYLAVHKLLSSRDRLWGFLKGATFSPAKSSSLAFDESGYLVQWVWMKKSLNRFYKYCLDDLPKIEASGETLSCVDRSRRKLDLLIGNIDRSIYENTGDMHSLSDSVWKRCGHPLVPAAASNWHAIERLRCISKKCSVLTEDRVGFAASLVGNLGAICLDGLVQQNHPCLHMEQQLKMDILGALCTSHWATTDETCGMTRPLAGISEVSAWLHAPMLLEKKMEEARANFAAKIKAATIDTTIGTVENQLDVEELEKMQATNSFCQNGDSSGEEIVQSLLERFGSIQIAQLAEIWCAREERKIVGKVSEMVVLLGQSDLICKLQAFLPVIRKFINVAAQTMWPIADLRPYQTLLWALECASLSPKELLHLLRCIFPLMMAAMSHHSWCNSFNNLEIVSQALVSPAFWSSEKSEDRKSVSHSGDQDEAPVSALNAGPVRLKQHVRDAALFRLMGVFVGGERGKRTKAPHSTLENWGARQKQYEEVLDLFGTLSFKEEEAQTDPFIIRHLFSNTMKGLKDCFNGDGDAIFCAAENITSATDMLAVASALEKCNHSQFQKLLTKVTMPLISSLREIKGNPANGDDNAWEEHVALAWIYVGLLRLHLLAPSSPMDPAKKPAAKMTQWDSYLVSLGSHLSALWLESALVNGNFAPDSVERCQLLQEAEHASNKRFNQAKKRVERPSCAPPFLQLFRETRHFIKTLASVESVLNLVDLIRKDGSQGSLSEVNWQSSANAYCIRLVTYFAPFEDVTIPCFNAIQNIQCGLRHLAHIHRRKIFTETQKIIGLQCELLRYPFGPVFSSVIHPEDIDLIPAVMRNHLNDERSAERAAMRCQISALFAALARLDLQRCVAGGKLDARSMKHGSNLLSSIIKSWHKLEIDVAEKDQSANSTILVHEKTKEDELAERAYREHFPNHGKEFHSIIESADCADSDGDVHDCKSVEISEISLTEEQISLLCSLHGRLYSSEKPKSGGDDVCRIRSFLWSYEAAGHLAQVTEWYEKQHDESRSTGAHTMAVALKSVTSWKMSHSALHPTDSCDDFYNDPNPSEVVKADTCLRRLLVRILQLLTAFPGNSVLVAVGQVVERMRRMDLSTVSLGKVLTGLEVVLRKAQEWEQHASHRVLLGQPLQEISRLVVEWRRLELQSWSALLNLREKHCVHRARRHFLRLYLLVNEKDDHGEMLPKGSNTSISPGWVWKVAGKARPGFLLAVHDNAATVELTKALDGFLLTAGAGEFVERLHLVGSLADQILSECVGKLVTSQRRFVLGRVLKSLWKHYSHFIPIIESTKGKLREPIEKRLKDEVKISRWDEQSYYALAASSEKSHRKLMKFLHEYDEVLEMNVGTILEQNFVSGIRSGIEATSESNPVTTVPQNRVIFPHIPCYDNRNDDAWAARTSLTNLRNKNRTWALIEASEVQCDKFVLRIKRYCTKMRKLLQTDILHAESPARCGANTSDGLCQSIFDRIEVLRGEKVTKPMKKRALVDLFKALKKNGFSEMKRSVPAQIREMIHVLQLPIPSNAFVGTKANAVELESAERYFYRSTVELSRLRSEVTMLGSDYMSQREMNLMVGFSEHGLLMLCQLRCMITDMIESLGATESLLEAFDDTGEHLPTGQTSLAESVEKFDKVFLSALENLQQIFLLLKTSTPLVKKKVKRESIRDITCIVEGCVVQLRDSYRPVTLKGFVSGDRLEEIKKANGVLQDVRSQIHLCCQKCRQSECFPTDAFEPCLGQINEALCGAQMVGTETRKTVTGNAVVGEVLDLVASTCKKTLLSIQTLCKHGEHVKEGPDSDSGGSGLSLWKNHAASLEEWSAVNIQFLSEHLLELISKLKSLHESAEMNSGMQSLCWRASADACTLVLNVVDASRSRLCDSLSFFKSTAKLEYILLRVFRSLVAKGFCSDNVGEPGEDGGEGDASGMNFEDDVEGTGMGEGEGKKDVTDQLESEEQLLGLKGDEQDDAEQAKNEQQQLLNEEEAEQGMEMEADFDGEMFDMPEQNKDEKEGDDDKEEELDREMGDGSDPNEDVVDEKMWDGDDEDEDEAEQNNEGEKFEKDSKMAGDALEDEMHTKEDGEEEKGGDPSKDQEASDESGKQQGKEASQDDEGEPKDDIVNDELEENYEDKHQGIDVRDGGRDEEEKDQGDDDMDLGDNLNLDGESGDEDNLEAGTEMDVDDGKDDNDDGSCSQGGEESAHAIVDEDAESSDETEEGEALESCAHAGGEEENRQPEEVDEEDSGQEQTDLNTNEEAQEPSKGDTHAVAAKYGTDSAKEENEEKEEGEGEGDENKADGAGAAGEQDSQSDGAGKDDAGAEEWQRGDDGKAGEEEHKSKALDVPNPFRDPGNAEKYWHEKLNMVEDKELKEADADMEEGADDEDLNRNESLNPNGVFEFTSKNQASSAQVLGGVAEEDAAQLDRHKEQPGEVDESPQTEGSSATDTKNQNQEGAISTMEGQTKNNQPDSDKSGNDAGSVGAADGLEQAELQDETEKHDLMSESSGTEYDDENRVISDLAQLRARGEESDNDDELGLAGLVETEQTTGISSAEATVAHYRWSKTQAETKDLSRRLCEKLRLVMEPLVATKLQGDYRTGKRINMKRVIGYIASGYRKDKIWLRRTKPAKRDYRILLAVDDSESMKKSGAGEMALTALATLANGMSQLEIGELGVASFGEDMQLLHPFNMPFTSESGINLFSNFTFGQTRTRTALCVESALLALESCSGTSSSMQLVFIISDGRIERDSRSKLRKLVREMTERNVLLVMIIVEGNRKYGKKKKDSIVNMKEVTFEKGKPKVKHFIEDYPFPYYMVLEDMTSLPEVLGDALRQWFEMLTQIQNSGMPT